MRLSNVSARHLYIGSKDWFRSLLAGRLRVERRQDLITDLLKEVAVKSSHNSLLKELLLAQPGKSYLLQNLIFLNVASELHGNEMSIDIADVSIAGAALSHALDHVTANRIMIKADRSNLEFVRLTSQTDVAERIELQGTPRLDKPLWSGTLPTEADVPALIDYCRETKAIKPEFDKSNEWLVMPGGVYSVGSYRNLSKHESEVQEPSVLIGSTRIGLTSFAIQINQSRMEISPDSCDSRATRSGHGMYNDPKRLTTITCAGGTP